MQGSHLKFTPRTAGYSIVLILLLVFNIVLFLYRSPLEITLMRMPGVLFQETTDGDIANLYNLKIINKSGTDRPVSIQLKSPPGVIKIVGGAMLARSNELIQRVVVVEIDRKNVSFGKIPVYFNVFADNRQIEEIRTSFIGPVAKYSK
jgi:polyferredoxin